MPEYLVIGSDPLPELARVHGDTPAEALASADPDIALPTKVTLIEIVGQFHVVDETVDEAEIVRRRRPPAPPTISEIEPVDEGVRVAWIEPAPDVDTIVVFHGGVEAETVPADALETVLSEAAPGDSIALAAQKKGLRGPQGGSAVVPEPE